MSNKNYISDIRNMQQSYENPSDGIGYPKKNRKEKITKRDKTINNKCGAIPKRK